MSPVEPIESAKPATAASARQSGGQAAAKVFTAERVSLAALLVIFRAFTWRGLLMFYSGDDLMNMYWAWTWNHREMAWANILVWKPMYRPLGEIVYLAFYSAFRFQPAPLYVFCWLLLIANVVAAYTLLRALFAAAHEALIALALILVHGAYMELYNSA